MRPLLGVLIGVASLLAGGCRAPNEELAPEDAFVEEDGPAPETDGPRVVGDGPATKPDKGGSTKKDLGAPKKDSSFTPADSGPPGSIKIAAVQYGPGMYTYVAGGCKSDLCALSQLVTEAKSNGAQYVVTPEYGADQTTAELSPALGDKPASSNTWPAGSIIKTFCALSDSLNINVIFNVATQEGSGSTAKLYNTEVVCDPSGTVIARHYKYYLYGEQGLTAGTSCCDYFSTPAGKAGLLICADINCIIALDASASSCTADGLKKMNAFVAGKPHIVFFSSFWAATGSSNTAWRPINVQSKFAKYANAYLAAANIITSKYHGGGVYKPDGTPIQTACDYGTTVGTTCKPTVVYGVVPP